MGVAARAEPVKLFLAVMYASRQDSEDCLAEVSARYGAVDGHYGPISFNFTDYYTKEMGVNLRKSYFTFKKPVQRDSLATAKTLTNRIEQDHALQERRRVNLDPGYVSRDKLVLASTKDFYHRIYLSAGIYAEVTLHFRQGRYRHFSWTYPDYMEPGFLEFLSQARAKLVGELKCSV